MIVLNSEGEIDQLYYDLKTIFYSYIRSKACKSPTEFFAERGYDFEKLKYARKMIFENDPELYESFLSSWSHKIKKRNDRLEAKKKQSIVKILYLIDNVDDFDLVEFWKLIPYDGEDDFLFKAIDIVRKNYSDKYPSFINFIADKGILLQEGLLGIDVELIRNSSFLVGDYQISASANQFIINHSSSLFI